MRGGESFDCSRRSTHQPEDPAARVAANSSTADALRIPPHWTVVGERRSLLTTTSPRLATLPAHAAINYLYALTEFACILGLRSVGLDPDIGWLHRDAMYRSAAALDVMEAARPTADGFALDLFRTRTFSRKEFVELATGHVRLVPSLARSLARAALPALEATVEPMIREVARILAASSPSPIRVRTRRASLEGGTVEARPDTKSSPKRVPSECRMRGVVLNDPERAICDECLPAYKAAKAERLREAGRDALARIGTSTEPDAVETRERRAAKARERMLEARRWERLNGSAFDVERYEREVMPIILSLTPSALARITGLSANHGTQVRQGVRRLHPMHWQALIDFNDLRQAASDRADHRRPRRR
jgi:CRISPR associated protein Cas1